MRERAIEKQDKYAHLVREVARMYHGFTVLMTPVVIGNLGETAALEEWLPHIVSFDDSMHGRLLSSIQRSALIANVRLIRSHFAHV